MTENDEGAVRALVDAARAVDPLAGCYPIAEAILDAIRAGRVPGIITRDIGEAWASAACEALTPEIEKLRAELERVEGERNENEGAFKVWRRRCGEAEDESKALAVHEVLGKERDQAIARLGEAERLLKRARGWNHHDANHNNRCAHLEYNGPCDCGTDDLLQCIDLFLARDSAGGMGGGET
jgi:hypothetical protein